MLEVVVYRGFVSEGWQPVKQYRTPNGVSLNTLKSKSFESRQGALPAQSTNNFLSKVIRKQIKGGLHCVLVILSRTVLRFSIVT